MHIRLCGWVSDKNIFTRPICGNKTTFFGPMAKLPPTLEQHALRKALKLVSCIM